MRQHGWPLYFLGIISVELELEDTPFEHYQLYMDGTPICGYVCCCSQEPLIMGQCGDCCNKLHNGIRKGQVK